MSGSSSGSVRFRDSSWPVGLRILTVPPPVPPGSAELHLCEARLSWWHGVAAQERADGKSNTQSMARSSMSNERVPCGVRRAALGAANGVPRGTHRARCAAHSARRVARGAWHGASDARRAACGAQHTAQVCSVHNTTHAPCTARGMRRTREAARAAPRGVRAAHPVWKKLG